MKEEYNLPMTDKESQEKEEILKKAQEFADKRYEKVVKLSKKELMNLKEAVVSGYIAGYLEGKK